MIEDGLIIVPAYNEAGVIESTLKELKNYARNILVVDDGSTDHTSELAKNLGVLVLRHPANLGYASALKTGFLYGLRYTFYDYFLTFDADGQHHPAFLERIIESLRNGEADFVIGSRYLEPAKVKHPVVRRAGSRVFAFFTSLLVAQKITDPTSGMVGLNRRVAKIFLSEFFPLDFPDADVVIMLARMGFKIKEVPVEMRASKRRGSMHSGVVKPIYYFFKMSTSMIHFALRRDLKEKRRELESVF